MGWADVAGMELVHVSAAMSLDGCIDHRATGRLMLSGPEDCRAVHEARAACDAILVGAGTVRRDDPRLTVRFPDLVERRLAQGLPASPAKVTLTRSGALDPECGFFRNGGPRIVLCPAAAVAAVHDRLGGVATVAGLAGLDAPAILATLSAMGIRRLFVEGGTSVLTLFLASGCFHRLRLAVAPFFVGEADAPRLVAPARFLHGADRRLRVETTRTVGNVAVIDLVNDGFSG